MNLKNVGSDLTRCCGDVQRIRAICDAAARASAHLWTVALADTIRLLAGPDGTAAAAAREAAPEATPRAERGGDRAAAAECGRGRLAGA